MRFLFGLFFALICSNSCFATTYNVNLFGPLPAGVTSGPSGSANTNACSATTCAGGGPTPALSFQAQPGDIINFGSLALSSFIFGDGRSQQTSQYIDANGQIRFVTGTPVAIYPGSLGVAYAYTSQIFLNHNFMSGCNSAVPNCLPSLQALMTTTQISLEFTLPTGFIELGWTRPYTYTPPPFVGEVLAAPVPQPSTWAMLLIGFASIGFAAYHRRTSWRQAIQSVGA